VLRLLPVVVQLAVLLLRLLLALLVLAVCGKLALDLLLMPSELYSIGDAGGSQ
jgi:hypothetical protein